MPRSDRFDHFTVPEADTDRDLARHDKQEVVRSSSPEGDPDVHYGKRFAETEAILRARSEERAARRASRAGDDAARDASSDAHLGSTDEQVSPTPAHPSSGAVADQVGMPALRRGAPLKRRDRRRSARPRHRDETPPLGATPGEELPPAAEKVLAETPGELLAAFADQVGRSLLGVGDAARQLGTAGREVAGLPVEAVRIVLRMGRSWLGRSPRRA